MNTSSVLQSHTSVMELESRWRTWWDLVITRFLIKPIPHLWEWGLEESEGVEQPEQRANLADNFR